MTKISVDLEMLTNALDDHSDEHQWCLDLELGEVIFVSDIAPEEDDELSTAMDENPKRFRFIDPLPSPQAFQVMAEFVESLKDEKASKALFRALNGPRPFRNFKDAQLSFPAIRDEWFSYHDKRYRDFAIAWLQEEGIEADIRSIREKG